MPAPRNPFEAAIRAGQPQMGCWLGLADPCIAEINAGAETGGHMSSQPGADVCWLVEPVFPRASVTAEQTCSRLRWRDRLEGDVDTADASARGNEPAERLRLPNHRSPVHAWVTATPN